MCKLPYSGNFHDHKIFAWKNFEIVNFVTASQPMTTPNIILLLKILTISSVKAMIRGYHSKLLWKNQHAMIRGYHSKLLWKNQHAIIRGYHSKLLWKNQHAMIRGYHSKLLGKNYTCSKILSSERLVQIRFQDKIRPSTGLFLQQGGLILCQVAGYRQYS